MSLYTNLLNEKEKLAVIGLGYVGLPIAEAFSKKIQVIGFDRNQEKIKLYQRGMDPTFELGDEVVKDSKVEFTWEEARLREAKFHIVAVPTPINQDKTPDLAPIEDAAEIVGRNMAKGSIVVFESTVYPGVTEEICIPILEKASGYRCGTDFKVGYSPERINPGDRVHRLSSIRKIISGTDEEAVDEIEHIYGLVIDAGTYPVSNIRTAEAIKVAENSQRDINIAFMNELAMVFDRMGIDTNEVVDGMNTKWNALGFRPGLVGGHCIGVDPYYFIYEAEQLGYHSQIILSGRRINDGMAEYVASAAVKQMILAGKAVREARVLILGLTFKENCPDIRNSKVADIVHYFKELKANVIISDPWADKKEVQLQYGIQLTDLDQVNDVDCIILAVAHREYRLLSPEKLNALFKTDLKPSEKVVVDVKGILNQKEADRYGFCLWRL